MFFNNGDFGESPFSSRFGSTPTKNNTNNSSNYNSSNNRNNDNGLNNFNYSQNDVIDNHRNILNITPSRISNSNSYYNTLNNSSNRNNSNDNTNPNRLQRMCVPSTIKIILESLEKSPNSFILYGIRVSSVTIVGWIIHKQMYNSRMIFRIADGTGGIDARIDIDTETTGEELINYLDTLKEGMIIRIVGQVIPGKGDTSSYISCYTAIKIENPSEYAYFHPIEVSFVANELCSESNIGYNNDSYFLNTPNIDFRENTPNILNLDNNDIIIPSDITDKIQQQVYKVVAYSIKQMKSEEEKATGIHRDIIIKQLRSQYEPTKVITAINDLESKSAVIYESVDGHYCIL
ncbi:OB-fold nucleic acid binding domain-containing protein [Cryptosporidium serpentis]